MILMMLALSRGFVVRYGDMFSFGAHTAFAEGDGGGGDAGGGVGGGGDPAGGDGGGWETAVEARVVTRVELAAELTAEAVVLL